MVFCYLQGEKLPSKVSLFSHYHPITFYIGIVCNMKVYHLFSLNVVVEFANECFNQLFHG